MSSKYLRRYTDIPALIYLLSEKKLTLLDPQSWDDTNDSYYLALYRKKKRLKSVLALCFTQGAESYQNWRVFAGGSGGVCVRFNRSELLKAVRGRLGLQMKPVRYLKLRQIRNETLKIDGLPFLKRFGFKHENEFRLIYESKRETVPKLDIPIPLSCIGSVTLSPWLHPDLSEQVEERLRSIRDCDELRIMRSTLISNEEWKGLGERAR